jgi:hypothetical protein
MVHMANDPREQQPRGSYARAYLLASARPVDGSHWHELLHRALNRLRERHRFGCAASTHREHTPNPLGGVQLEEPDAFIRARAARDGQPHVRTPAG